MGIAYFKDGQQITNDFRATITAYPQTRHVEVDPETGDEVITYTDGEEQIEVSVPFENLALLSDEQLAGYGVTRTTTADVPETISDRQFYQLLALNGTIEQSEALAAVATGTIPAALDAYVETLPTDAEKFNARMLLSGAVSFNRHHPLTEAVGAARGLSSEQLDQFWIAASNI